MEAKDTVMSESHIKSLVTIRALEAHNRGFLTNFDMDDGVKVGEWIAKAQAEISFKAGQDYAMSKQGHEAVSYLEGALEGKQLGIREVVEWCEARDKCQSNLVWTVEWQSQKKKWGIE